MKTDVGDEFRARIIITVRDCTTTNVLQIYYLVQIISTAFIALVHLFLYIAGTTTTAAPVPMSEYHK